MPSQKCQNSQGVFVTFEGIDGSGKSTQMALCAQALEKMGYCVTTTRNPGGTSLGQEIRSLLLHRVGFVSPTCELMLYMADRAQHMDEVVFPALEEGKVVLCDRHIDSTVAYQGYGRELSLPLIHQLNDIAIQGRRPDLTLLYDGDSEALSLRVSGRGEADRLERESLAFKQRVREGYLKLASEEPERVHCFNALEDIDTLHDKTKSLILSRLKPSF